MQLFPFSSLLFIPCPDPDGGHISSLATRRILMGGELRSHVLLAEDILGMCSKGRGSTRRLTSDTVLTVSRSSLFRPLKKRLVDNLLVKCK